MVAKVTSKFPSALKNQNINAVCLLEVDNGFFIMMTSEKNQQFLMKLGETRPGVDKVKPEVWFKYSL